MPIGGLLYLLLLLLLPSGAFAQSSVGQAMNAATGRSLADAVDQNLKDMIDREVFGGAGAGGIGGEGGATSGGTFGMTVSPTGRLRTSSHDGLKVANPGPDNQNFAWRTDEASIFVNGTYALPGKVMGGQLKFAGFAGYNWLSLDLKENPPFTLDGEQFGSGENGSFIAGGTALWAKGNTYALATVVGFWGETKLNDNVDDCFPTNPVTCDFHRYKFNTSGFIGTGTAGQVFPLSAGNSGPMLDLRGSVSFTQNTGDPFLNHDGVEQKYKFSTWTGTAAATLFSNMSMPNGALLRPYLMTYVRQEIGYNNRLRFVDTGVPGIVDYDQAHTYGGVDTGMTYTLGNMTLGAAIYYDFSADERTLGGRLGASWKFN